MDHERWLPEDHGTSRALCRLQRGQYGRLRQPGAGGRGLQYAGVQEDDRDSLEDQRHGQRSEPPDASAGRGR